MIVQRCLTGVIVVGKEHLDLVVREVGTHCH
jgi:hypothetical protein